MNKNYLKYLLKSKKQLITAVILFAALIFIPQVLTNRSAHGAMDAQIEATVYAVLLSVILPIYLFSFVHLKRACDSFFSLPVSKKEILITTLVVIDVLIAGIFLAQSGMIQMLCGIRFFYGTNMQANFAGMILTTLGGIVLISMFVSALYFLANSVLDGIVTIAGYMVLPFVLLLSVMICISAVCAGNYFPFDAYKIADFSLIYCVISSVISFYENNSFADTITLIRIVSFAAHLIFSMYVLNRHFVSRKVERAQQTSSEILCYPFLLAVYATILTFAVSVSYQSNQITLFYAMIMYVVIFIFYTVFTFVYRKKIAIRLKDVAGFLAVIAITAVFSYFAYSTQCFGIAKEYPLNNYLIHYRYTSYEYRGDLESSEYEGYYLKYLEERGIRANELNVEFELDISEAATESDAFRLVEKARNTSIDNFYKKNVEEMDLGVKKQGDLMSSAVLDVFDNYHQVHKDDDYIMNEYDRMYYYFHCPVLSIEELEVINEYVPVRFLYWYDGAVEGAIESASGAFMDVFGDNEYYSGEITLSELMNMAVK